MSVFEFGDYWDVETFVLFMLFGLIICILASQGAKKYYLKSRLLVCPNKRRNFYYNSIFIAIMLLYGFKDKTFGADTANYLNRWYNSRYFEFEFGVTWEPLFVLFNYITRAISDNYTVYFLIAGAVVAYGYERFIREFWGRDCDYLFLILMAVSLNYDMNIMRSAIGMSFILISFCHLKDNRIFKALCFSVIATLFQYTLVVNVAFIAFYKILDRKDKLSLKRVWFYFLVALTVSFIVVLLLHPILKASERYGHYITTSTPSLIGNWAIILSGVLGIVNLNNRIENNPMTKLGIIAALFSIILLVPYLMLGAYRLTMYYFMPRLMLWGYSSKHYFIDTLQQKWVRRVLVFLAVMFYALFTMSRRSGNIGFAYHFIQTFSH